MINIWIWRAVMGQTDPPDLLVQWMSCRHQWHLACIFQFWQTRRAGPASQHALFFIDLVFSAWQLLQTKPYCQLTVIIKCHNFIIIIIITVVSMKIYQFLWSFFQLYAAIMFILSDYTVDEHYRIHHCRPLSVAHDATLSCSIFHLTGFWEF
jgi:hypothetical protein